ncbi:hypothetical protein COO60DRAFT_1521190, partial [Scenedesmus sp. NREL 46B-D3]
MFAARVQFNVCCCFCRCCAPCLLFLNFLQPLHSDIDLLNPPAELERTKHKLKRLVQSPNSFFMDVKCTGCFS